MTKKSDKEFRRTVAKYLKFVNLHFANHAVKLCHQELNTAVWDVIAA